ncbi:MAG: LPS export ABC transporter permease LptG [Gammaproteobacteria bacterium]|nr:LPS export ABC transporter permease LptG [Gammaproteobacteria bacterium]
MIAGGMDRHVGRTVLLAVLVTLACFLTLVTLFALVEELQDRAAGYTPLHAALYIAYTTPGRVVELVPYAAFIGALLGLGVLSNHGELTAFRAAGISLLRLFAAAALPVAALLATGQWLGEVVAGRGEEAGATVKFEAAQSAGIRAAAGHVPFGRWHREGLLYTYIDGYGGGDRLVGVRQFRVGEDRNLVFSRRAAFATFLGTDASGAGGAGPPGWLLHDVRETHFDYELGATVVRSYDTLPWRTRADPELLNVKSLLDPGRMSVSELTRQIDYMEREGLDSSRHGVAWWNKVLQPLAVLGLVWLALGFVAGPLREVSMGARLSVGIVGGLAFNYLRELFAPMAVVVDFPPWLAVAVPIAVCWLVGAALVRRAA